jgi:hypothetical protein
MDSFEIKTLVDITQTGQTKFKSQDRLLINQQANWNTFLQVVSMRVNPLFENAPIVKKMSVEDLGFGTDYEGEHNVWTFTFETERELAITPTLLTEDFDLVPVINGLTETILNNSVAFRTNNPSAQNIVFKLADKEVLAQ